MVGTGEAGLAGLLDLELKDKRKVTGNLMFRFNRTHSRVCLSPILSADIIGKTVKLDDLRRCETIVRPLEELVGDGAFGSGLRYFLGLGVDGVVL